MPSEHSPETFGAGSIVAGRYRMEVRLGRGGMGEVWRADDLVLNTPVALKRLYARGPEARLRLLHEVRLARQITHPSICRVFDVGESDGEVFYSMELIEGEDLATLLGHASRLSSDKVIDLAKQLCDGLTAAHEAGVLHRDLKPANVLIDAQGQVRITDFGIAVTQSDADDAPMLGTPEYMAPEQLVRGAPLTEQTDIYALGLILFELVTGTHALTAGSIAAPVPPSRLVRDIDPRLDKAIFRALSPEPRDRFASAADMAAQLPSPQLRSVRPESRHRWWWAAAAALLAAVAGAAAMWFVPSVATRDTLTAQDTIVLADFQNRTGDAVFDRALKVALAVALEQSPFLKVFPDDRAAETLRLMGRPPTEPVTRALAREIAQREHLKALISGSISRLGQLYVIAIEATNAETGDTMALEQVEAPTQEDVLTALGSATSKLRQTLGESLASIRKFDVPLPRATTPSLEALNAYARALDNGRMDLRLAAIPQLKRALELDPDFALAQAQLSAVYSNTGQTSLAPQHARRAFELRDRVSDRERFFIAFRYHRDATQNWEEARELSQAWTAAYPREALAWNALGIARLRFGDYEGAIAPIREAMRIEPKFAPLYSNLASVLMALGRIDQAKAILREGEAQGIDYSNAHRIAYLLAFMEGDQVTLDAHLKAGMRLDQNSSAFGWPAHALTFQGRFEEARERVRVGSEVAAQNGFREVAAGLVIEDFEARALIGRCGDIGAEVTRALGLSRDNFALERSARALILCDREAEAARLIDEVKTRYPEATLIHRISLPIIEALIALNHDQPDRALKALEPVRPFDHAPWAGYWPAWLRGRAYLALRDGAAARQEFQSIVANRGEDPASLLYPLGQLGLARAAALAGDAEGARTEYARLSTMWKDADPDVPIVQEVRRLAGSPAGSSRERVN